MRAHEELASGHSLYNVIFPLDEAGKLVASRAEIEKFRSAPKRSWLLAGIVCWTKRRMGIAQVDSS